mgnify:CR=1 FL=1
MKASEVNKKRVELQMGVAAKFDMDTTDIKVQI